LGKIALLFVSGLVFAQQNSPVNDRHDSQSPTFRTGVNVVLVPVVVRDRQGRAVGNLTQSDFQLLDNGRPQTISAFSVIRHVDSVSSGFAAPPSDPLGGGKAQMATSRTAPQSVEVKLPPARSFIYLFDDLGIRFEDLARVREAAGAHFKNSDSGTDRAAIYTVSGRNSLEFTTDREKLEDAVSRLRWGVVAGRGGMDCPDVSYYMADLVINKADSQALDALAYHTVECAHVRPELARQIARGASERRLMMGREDTKLTLATVRRAIRRLAGLPGERVIILVTPGFFAATAEGNKAMTEVLELAAKNNVIIHGLSVRGVVQAPEEEEVARRVMVGRQAPPRASSPDQRWIRYRREGAQADGDVMKDLAEGTGGTFFENNNDLRLGFKRLATVPEYSYLLAFSPVELNPDGSFHKLKILTPDEKGATIEARRGYFALARDAEPRSSTAELQDVFFSPTERNDIPVVVQPGYSKPNTADVVKVYVAARISVGSFSFEKIGGRSHDAIEVVVGLFDSAGTYVTDAAETERLSLDDDTLRKGDPAISLRWEFPGNQPGDYFIRFVVREPKTGATTLINRMLKIL
jgi:VWFA-related protein